MVTELRLPEKTLAAARESQVDYYLKIICVYKLNEYTNTRLGAKCYKIIITKKNDLKRNRSISKMWYFWKM